MKKFISVLLALMLVLSTSVVAFSAYNVVDTDAPSLEEAMADYEGEPARVYFMMPNGKNGPLADDDVYVHVPEKVDPETGEVIEEAHDDLVIEAGGKAPSWYNDFNIGEDGKHYAGIFWWDAPASPAAWPGYRMEIDDYDNCVYYADVPGIDDLTSGIFNNGVDGGMDKTLPVYYKAAQSGDLNMEGFYPDEDDILIYGTPNPYTFDGCIFVVDPNQISITALSGKQSCGGFWYVYYGNGCYGKEYAKGIGEDSEYPDGTPGWTDDVAAMCMNPDHFDENGNHIGFHEEPTEAPAEPTEAPAEPTEAPAEPTEAPAEPTEAPAEPTEAPAEPTTAPVEPTEAPAEPTEAPVGDTYIVAGNATDIFGTSWNGNDANNTMTYANDVWSKEYTVSGAMKDVQLKAVKNGTTWIGDETGNNVTFNLDGEGTFTVYCDGTKTWVEGDIVSFSETLDIESVTLVGNGIEDGSGWLNNIAWDPAAEANHMTNTWDSIYETEYTLGEYDPSDIEFKFAINDAWTYNFGLAEGGVIENDVVTDAVFNGPTNLKITGLQPGTTIKIRIDLSNFDFKTGTGADMLVTWTDPTEPTEAPAEPTEAPHVHDLTFVPEVPATYEADGVAAHYICSGCDKLFADATGTVEVTAEELVLPKLTAETKYYIVGNFTDWEVKDEYELTQNLASETDEYMIDVNLDTDNQFKIVGVSGDTQTWYPDGMGNNYGENGEITADGLYTVYFRPNIDGGDDWFYGQILATLHEEQPTEAPVVTPTEAPALKPKTYYLYGTIESMNQNWSLDPALEMTEVESGLYKIEGIALKKAELGVDQFGNPIKNSDPAGPEIIGDNFKVVQSSKRGTSVSYYFPDGVDNNRTVSEDGVYTIYFRPAGDGNPEDGWIKVYTMTDPEGDPAAHGATVGGYMYKFEKTGEYPVTEPTEAPAEPTEAPVEPTEAPVEPTEAPVEPTEAPVEPTEAPAQDTYIVAGNATDIFGTSWNGNDANNTMTYANDVWSKEYTVSAAMNEVQLKAVKNGETWIGDETGNNVTFNLSGAGTFTVYCDGTKTWVEGDIVSFSDGLDVKSVTLVGNGTVDGSGWLNNIAWDPAAEANHMTEVSDGVYEIEFTLGEYDPSDVEFKFAINDAWTHNFGLADNGVFENGVETDAIYNGSQNLKIMGLAEGTTIKAQLDLTGFDFNTKTGAKMTITWGVEEPVPADTYIVAGNATDIFGTSWNGNDANNTMTYANDVWSKEYTVSAAMDDVQLKAVKNGETWIGDETGNNVTFNLSGAGTFTVYCDGEKTWVEGDIVEFPCALDVQSVTLVGNGSVDGDNWLNNIEWDPAAAANHMTEVADGVYEIEFTLGEYDTSDPEFKFAINDAWTHNFGLADNGVFENGVETDAIYNGSTNLKIEGLTAGTTIKAQLDLTGFDFNTKTGAKMTITWTDSGSETVLLGDVNNDGAVDILDANIIQRYDAMFDVSDYAEYLYLGDVNGDGDIDILDATLIQRYDAGMTVKYPIGQPVAE